MQADIRHEPPLRGAPLLRRVFAIPLLLAIATVLGLLAALLGQGLWHVLSWVSLSISIAVVAWYVARG